jgi:hypothetical protein
LGARNQFAIKGPTPWRFPAKSPAKDAYQQEHDDLFAAIINDKPYNEAESGAISTMTAILGRMATYSGQQIEWEDAFNSKLKLVPDGCTWETEPPVLPDADGWYPVAKPGTTVAV